MPKIIGAVLVGPRRLESASPGAFVDWGSLLRVLRETATPDPLPQGAIRHLEVTVESSIGFKTGSTANFREMVRTLSCLRELLGACLQSIKVRYDPDSVWMTRPDGEPIRRGGWAWFGLSVPFRVDGRKMRLGIYEYADGPEGKPPPDEALWLEAYDDRSDESVLSLPFRLENLAPENLDRVRADFTAAWAAKDDAPQS